MADAPAPELRIDLIADDASVFNGETRRHPVPVRAWCRLLVRRGYAPDLPLSVFRDGELVLRITSIGAVAAQRLFAPLGDGPQAAGVASGASEVPEAVATQDDQSKDGQSADDGALPNSPLRSVDSKGSMVDAVAAEGAASAEPEPVDDQVRSPELALEVPLEAGAEAAAGASSWPAPDPDRVRAPLPPPAVDPESPLPVETLGIDLYADDMAVLPNGDVLRHRTPVLAACRLLIERGHDPATKLVAHRDGKPSMYITSIGAGAKLDVAETSRGPRFVSLDKRLANAPAAVSGALYQSPLIRTHAPSRASRLT